MDGEKRRIRETFLRAHNFLTNNADDFPDGSIVAEQTERLSGFIERLEELLGEQTGGFTNARFNFRNKKSARKNLLENMREFMRTAQSMNHQFPHIVKKFRMPRGNNDIKLIADARAFLTAATPYENDFIKYEMPADCLERLRQDIEIFEESFAVVASATNRHVAATAEIKEIIRQGLIVLKILKGVVKNKYRDDAGKLAAWLSASHIERPPKKKSEKKEK